eukprot:GEMP01035304.1.p1 GENE.GEMP01035304.1~~GEMP01035304.1.p1  ORF type:complete len:479 (+),score=57.83 GEMP01035304.1:336-1772(+)
MLLRLAWWVAFVSAGRDYFPLPDHCPRKSVTDEAYITLLYGTEFILPARVLGKSLDNSNTNRQKWVIVTRDVSLHSINQLRRDCWQVMVIDEIKNPFPNAPKRFDKVLTKLSIWNLEEFKKVVYLDADVLVAQNIDELFDCKLFCASVRHSDRFNTGVMVLAPSKVTYDDMLTQLPNAVSYTGADQGFLNVYYKDLHTAPELGYSGPGVTDNHPLQRLSSVYNADEGMYYFRGSTWLFGPGEIKLFHYTFGPVRPWKWWVYPIFNNSHAWIAVRETLYESYTSSEFVHFSIPYVLLVTLVWWLGVKGRKKTLLPPRVARACQRAIGTRGAVMWTGISVALLSGVVAFFLVPSIARPISGLTFFAVLSYDIILFLGSELYVIHWETSAAAADDKLHSVISKRMCPGLLLSTAVLFMILPMTFYIPANMNQANRLTSVVSGLIVTAVLVGVAFRRIIVLPHRSSKPSQDPGDTGGVDNEL